MLEARVFPSGRGSRVVSSPFKRVKAPAAPPKDPEELFTELKKSGDAPNLWLHQGDVLRAYAKSYIETPDLVLQLPTGAGKTLIGLLIAEWRRRARNERVLFVCPTRQLAKQVANHARQKHGIDVALFVGPKGEFEEREVAAYVTAAKVGVGTYSTIFNFRPGLEPPQFLILDDAHAAETYVAGAWSLVLDRKKFESTFDAVVGLFKDELPQSFLSRLENAALSDHALNFELIHTDVFADRAGAFSDLVAAALSPDVDKNSFFRWQMIQDHLGACGLFLSPTSVLLRPLIAPTWDSTHFSAPKQRLYMSATAGTSGDLERMFGRGNLIRMPPPSAFERRAIGRRLFLFPDAAMKTEEAVQWTAGFPLTHKRAAYLARDGQRAAAISKYLTGKGVKVVKAEEHEDDLAPFTEAAPAALVATARFDGIDLPGDDCRVLVLLGRPDAVNLQERFFLARLGMRDILRDRMLTRFTQAVGRCTRDQADYAAIVPIGRSLFEFCAKKEIQAFMHPELAAEIQFGIAQMGTDKNSLNEMLHVFLARDERWAGAEEDLKALRDAHKQVEQTPVSQFLAKSAPKEVEFVRALWSVGHTSRAAEIARDLAESVTIPDLSPYRAWWAYQAAAAYHQLAEKEGIAEAIPFRDRYRAMALAASGMSSWYGHVLPTPTKKLTEAKPSEFDVLAAKNVGAFLAGVGVRGPKFDQFLLSAESQLGTEAHVPFEQGIEKLGILLGWHSNRPGGDADPDGIWRMPPNWVLGFEAKSEESEGNGLSKSTLNQAQGHYAWLEHNGAPREKTRVIVVSPRLSVHKLAAPHAKGLWHVTPTELVELFASAADVLRNVRARIADPTVADAPDVVLRGFFELGFSPEGVLSNLLSRPVDKMPESDD